MCEATLKQLELYHLELNGELTEKHEEREDRYPDELSHEESDLP
jgi:hypothetical protein